MCVIGEGEITIQDLVYNFDKLHMVRGMAYRGVDGDVKNSARQRIKNPDIIPFQLGIYSIWIIILQLDFWFKLEKNNERFGV